MSTAIYQPSEASVSRPASVIMMLPTSMTLPPFDAVGACPQQSGSDGPFHRRFGTATNRLISREGIPAAEGPVSSGPF
jgi:hypothetical protein